MLLAQSALQYIATGYKVIELHTTVIKPCIACGFCAKNYKCVMDAYPQDEMSSIRENLHAADMLFLVSPIHFSGLSALMTAFISRLQPEWARSQSPGEKKAQQPNKKGILVLTAGSLYPNMFEAAKISAAAVFRTLGFAMSGLVTASQTDTIDINKNFQALERAQALGARLNE